MPSTTNTSLAYQSLFIVLNSPYIQITEFKTLRKHTFKQGEARGTLSACYSPVAKMFVNRSIFKKLMKSLVFNVQKQ